MTEEASIPPLADGESTSEYEIKCFSTPELVAQLVSSELLADAHDEWVTDVYLDTPDRRLFLSGLFLRLRGTSRLQLKYSPPTDGGLHREAVEVEASLADCGPVLSVINRFLPLGSLAFWDFEPFVTVSRRRRTVASQGVLVVMDDVMGLGSFVEVEAIGRGGAAKVQDLERRLSLRHLPVGYVELWLRQREPDLYRLGRYRLPEDVESRTGD